jgi:hypothetical protein
MGRTGPYASEVLRLGPSATLSAMTPAPRVPHNAGRARSGSKVQTRVIKHQPVRLSDETGGNVILYGVQPSTKALHIV